MKKLVFIIGLTTFLLLSPVLKAHAVECRTDAFNFDTRTLTACFEGFATEADLKNTTVEFKCTGNSNVPDLSICRGVSSFTFKLSNAQIGHNEKGFRACVAPGGLNRAIGKMVVTATNTKTGQQVCTSQEIYTRPPDWEQFKEGLPWQGDVVSGPTLGDVCKSANNDAACIDCFVNQGGSWTAIGCIPTSPSGFMERFLGLGVGLAGGIAFLLILFSGFQMLTSVGNPEKLNAGKELLTSAISGLILIIFSIFLLRLIGVDILGLPGFE